MNKSMVAIIVVVVAIAAFFGGVKYQESKSNGTPRVAGANTTGQGNVRFGGGRNGGMRPTAGEITSSDDKSITIKMQDGSSKIVLLSDKTQINKAEKASKDDLKTGERVAVFGTENSDGSVTAQNIQLNPQMMAMGGGNGKQPNTAPKSPDAKEIVVEGSNYKFSPNTITVKKGEKTRIVFKNTGGFHDFRVDELNIATAVIPTGKEDFVEFTPDKTGSFEFYCSVGNHRAMGMKGTITVE